VPVFDPVASRQGYERAYAGKDPWCPWPFPEHRRPGTPAAGKRPRVLWQRGRLSLLWEPRDLRTGVFLGEKAVYVVLVPCLPLRWEK